MKRVFDSGLTGLIEAANGVVSQSTSVPQRGTDEC